MDRITNLTPEQAQHAIVNLFELLPEPCWQGGKPTPSDVKDLAGEAPQYLVALEQQDDATRGEIAREVLRRFACIEAACPLVDQAIEKSLQPRLVPLPLLILPLLIVLQGIQISTPSGKALVQIGVPGSGADLVKSLAEFAKQVPSGVWGWVTKSK